MAADGWAAQALRLGWHPLELWGGSPDRGGKPAKQYLEQFITTREWRSMDPDTKREFLKETMTEFRASARDGLKERFPELQAGKLPPLPKRFVLPPLPPGFVLAK